MDKLSGQTILSNAAKTEVEPEFQLKGMMTRPVLAIIAMQVGHSLCEFNIVSGTTVSNLPAIRCICIKIHDSEPVAVAAQLGPPHTSTRC